MEYRSSLILTDLTWVPNVIEDVDGVLKTGVFTTLASVKSLPPDIQDMFQYNSQHEDYKTYCHKLDLMYKPNVSHVKGQLQ